MQADEFEVTGERERSLAREWSGRGGRLKRTKRKLSGEGRNSAQVTMELLKRFAADKLSRPANDTAPSRGPAQPPTTSRMAME